MESTRNIFALRPLEIKHLFEFAIRIYRFNFLPLFLSLAIVQLPISLMTLPLVIAILDMQNDLLEMNETGEPPGQEFFLENLDLGIFVAAMVIFSLAYQLLILPLGNVICCRLATQAIFGQRLTLLEAFQFAKTRYWPTQVALATFLLPLLVISLLLLLPVLAFNMSGDETGIMTSALFALFVIMIASLATLLLFFRFFPALFGVIQSCEDPEGEGIFGHGVWYLKRAYELSGGYFLRLFGLIYLLWIIVYFINSGFTQSVQLIVQFAKLLMDGEMNQAGLSNAFLSNETDMVVIGISLVISMLVGLIFPPLLNCYYVLLYYDLRFRKEGLDLKLVLGTEHPPQ